MLSDLIVLRHKLPLGVIPGRWQVGFADLPSEPGIHNPRRLSGSAVPPLQDLGLWIPGSARYARGPGMTG
jgi:hypothetical protein